MYAFGYLMCGVVLTGSLLGAQLVDAATYYVATTGNDTTGTGAIGAPFRTFGKALSVTRPGDTVFIRGGTYLTSVVDTIPCGTSSAPISLRNYQSEQAIIKRAAPADRPRLDTAQGDCGHILIEGSYNASTDARGLVLDGLQTRLGSVDTGANVGANHITIRNVEYKNNHTYMITEGAHHIHLDNVDIHHTTASHCTYMNWNDSIIENSKIHHCENHGVHWRKSSGDQGKCQPECGTRRNIIRNTKLYSNGTTGLNWAYGEDNQFYNNMVYNNREFGINVAGVRYKFWNNTIVNNNTNNTASQGGMRLQSPAEVINNIVWGNNSQQIFGTGFSGSTLHHNITTQDPLLVNLTGGDLRLRSSSPAINAGATLSTVPRDFFGARRPVGPTYDIGMHEFGGQITCPTGDCTPPSVPSNLILTRISATQIDGD
jgi:hypothetical protein